MITRLCVLLICLAVLPALPAQEDDFDAVPEPPELPDPVVSGQPIEPEVTIIRRENELALQWSCR